MPFRNNSVKQNVARPKLKEKVAKRVQTLRALGVMWARQ